MAPNTRSGSSETQSDNDASGLTLADVMKSLNTIIANQTTHFDNISSLDKRMTALENLVFVNEEVKNTQNTTIPLGNTENTPSTKSEPGQRDPFTMPGKPTFQINRSRVFMAPDRLPGL